MAELNQNKTSKLPDRPDTARKLHFTLEINEQLTKRLTHVLQNRSS